jgi:hypothetical protein
MHGKKASLLHSMNEEAGAERKEALLGPDLSVCL